MCHPCRGFLAILGPVIPPLPRWATLCRPSGTFSNTELVHYNPETLKGASFGHNALKQKGRPGFAGTPCESPWAIERLRKSAQLRRRAPAARWSAIPGGGRFPKGFEAFGRFH